MSDKQVKRKAIKEKPFKIIVESVVSEEEGRENLARVIRWLLSRGGHSNDK